MGPVPATVAFVTLARGTFDVSYARDIQQRSLAALRELDGVTVVGPADVLIEPDEARRLGLELAAERPDLLIVQNGTFALGNLAIELAQTVPAPLLLWAVNEPILDGGALRSNSLVGTHVNASNLYKLGYRPQYLYGMPEALEIQARLRRACRVAGAIRRLGETQVGLIGSHAIGFYNLDVDKLALRQTFGVDVRTLRLEAAFGAARSLPEAEADEARAELEALYSEREEVRPEAMTLMARQFAGLRRLAQENGFGGLAVRCWPEWANEYGVAACGTVSALNTVGVTTGCEGDVDGAVTMLLGRALTGEPAFLTDFITAEPEENTAYFWHIGCAACQLATPDAPRQLHSHFGGGKGVTAGFALKPGRLTMTRISHDGQRYRLFLTTGEALPTEMLARGVFQKVRFDAPVQAVLDMVLENGVEHHFAVIYGDVSEELRLFARWKNLPVLEPGR